jgi:hypothetical protein
MLKHITFQLGCGATALETMFVTQLYIVYDLEASRDGVDAATAFILMFHKRA